MANTFDGTGDYLRVNSAPVTAYGVTMACWFNKDATGSFGGLMTLADNTTQNNRWIMYVNSSNVISLESKSGGVAVTASTSTTISAATWMHACFVGVSATDRRVFLNGGGKGTNGTSNTPASLATLNIANDANSGLGLAGKMAEAAIWNVALSDAEVADLAQTVSPLWVRPESLAFYLPMFDITNVIDLVGQLTLSVNGNTAASDHPPIMYPSVDDNTNDPTAGQPYIKRLGGIPHASMIRSSIPGTARVW